MPLKVITWPLGVAVDAVAAAAGHPRPNGAGARAAEDAEGAGAEVPTTTSSLCAKDLVFQNRFKETFLINFFVVTFNIFGEKLLTFCRHIFKANQH